MSREITVTITAVYAAAEKVRAGQPCIIITSDSKHDWMMQYSNVCVVKFADTEVKNHINAIQPGHVRDIASFLEGINSSELIVACDAGQSRSSAAAAAILCLYGCDDGWIWESEKYRPNVLVYKTILEYYEPLVRVDSKLRSIRVPDAYRYYRKYGEEPILSDYEHIIERNAGNQTIQYGFAYGSRKSHVMFIKTGGGGDIYGADNKYLRAASYIRAQHDMTVIVSSNPYDGSDALADAEDVIKEYIGEKGFSEKEAKIYYFGYSDGARLASDYGMQHGIFTDFLMYNLPIEPDETDEMTARLVEIDREKTLILAFGEEDESYKAAEGSLRSAKSPLELHVVKGAEHTISEDQLLVLPELFFSRAALKENGIEEM